MTRVLLTFAGGVYGLGVSRSLRAAVTPYRVVATDADRFSIQRAEGDERHLVPRASDQGFIPAIKRLVRSAGVDFVWPGHDSDVLAFARGRDELGAATFLPALADIEICRNKLSSYERWRERSVPVPDTMLVNSSTDLSRAFDEFGGEVWLRANRGAGR